MSIHTRHLLIAITMTLSACSQSDRRGEGKTFVLVHGAWMGAAGWEPVADRLRAEGAEVIVLVGHSMGGMVVSATAEERAPDIARLVYLAAYVPEDGQSLFDLAMSDEDSEVGESLVDNHDGTVGIRPEAFADLFCADCDPFTRDDLIAGYRDEPVAPLATPVSLTDAGFGSVPRTYIGTARDRVISPALQAHMIDATPMDRAVTLDTSHVPMLAAPGAVVDALLAE